MTFSTIPAERKLYSISVMTWALLGTSFLSAADPQTNSEPSAILNTSSHDVRLKNMIKGRFDTMKDSARPSDIQIVASLQETEKISVIRADYKALLNSTKKMFEDRMKHDKKYGETNEQKNLVRKELIQYLYEQYKENKIVAELETEPKAFKVDLLVMLRIAGGGDPRHGFRREHPHLYALYERLCIKQ